MADHTFTSVLWRWEAQDAWRFVTVPADLTHAIRLTAGPPKGFGSVRVEVTVGATTWRTSVFPDTHRGSYVLPIKRAVRQAEDLDDGDEVTVTLRVLHQNQPPRPEGALTRMRTPAAVFSRKRAISEN